MKHRYYGAYGSNLNLAQMKDRCPEATVVGTAQIDDYELLFKGCPNGHYLTIEEQEGCQVSIGVWDVNEKDELSLDGYEDIPDFYYKKEMDLLVTHKDTGEETLETIFLYIMHEDNELGEPSERYWDVCSVGYEDFDFDQAILEEALEKSR